jgi:molecular chaperone GrpE
MAEQEKNPAEEILESPVTDEQVIDAAAEAADAAELPDAQTLAQELETVTSEMDELRDQLLRTQADFMNVRRRAEQDVEKAHKFGVEKFANEMLPVVDSLERAVESFDKEDAATQAIREGVELTLSMLVAGLGKFKIESVDPQGAAFDPALHQAMSLVDAPDTAPNTVVAVVQKGYTLNGRLLRPAMVMVSKS